METSNDKQAVIRVLQKYNKGAGVIKASQFAQFLGVDRHTAKRKLAGLPAYQGIYYMVGDVADRVLKEMI